MERIRSASSRGVVGDLLLAQLKPDQQLKAGTGERGADVRFGERIDRGIVRPGLALGGDPLADVFGQGRFGAIDLAGGLGVGLGAFLTVGEA